MRQWLFRGIMQEQGIDVQGIDISERQAKYATQKLGLPITIGEIDDVNLPPQYFDIISMWHTLEHTPNPGQVMEKGGTG